MVHVLAPSAGVGETPAPGLEGPPQGAGLPSDGGPNSHIWCQPNVQQPVVYTTSHHTNPQLSATTPLTTSAPITRPELSNRNTAFSWPCAGGGVPPATGRGDAPTRTAPFPLLHCTHLYTPHAVQCARSVLPAPGREGTLTRSAPRPPRPHPKHTHQHKYVGPLVAGGSEAPAPGREGAPHAQPPFHIHTAVISTHITPAPCAQSVLLLPELEGTPTHTAPSARPNSRHTPTQ